jgi:hypothetical protein
VPTNEQVVLVNDVGKTSHEFTTYSQRAIGNKAHIAKALFVVGFIVNVLPCHPIGERVTRVIA